MRKVNLLGEGLLAYRPFSRIQAFFTALSSMALRMFQLLGEKVLASARCVQLIVFFGAIREILKKEIYGADK